MSTYEHEYSDFPVKLINTVPFKDVDETVAPLINYIQKLREQGKYTEAAKRIRDNEELLKPYVVDAGVINTIIEEIYNTQIFAKNKKQSVYVEENEPVPAIEYDIWIGGLE